MSLTQLAADRQDEEKKTRQNGAQFFGIRTDSAAIEDAFGAKVWPGQQGGLFQSSMGRDCNLRNCYNKEAIW